MAKKTQLAEDRAGGSVWTSFSDLSTTMSVIFLVMFVVAVLKLTLSTMETINTKEAQKKYLDGEIPDSIQKKIDDKSNKVKNTIADMTKVQQTINQRTKEINDLIKNMESHKNDVDFLLKEQAKRDVLLSKVNEKLKIKKTETRKQTKTIGLNKSASLIFSINDFTYWG